MQSAITLNIRDNVCIIFNCALAVITGLLLVSGSNDIRYETLEYFYADEQFPGLAEDWTKKGDPDLIVVDEGGIFIESTLEENSEENYIFQKLVIPAVNDNKHNNGSERLIRVQGEIHISDNFDVLSSELPRDKQAALMIWLYDASGEAVRYVTLKSFAGLGEGAFSVDRTLDVSAEISSAALAFLPRESKASFHIKKLAASTVAQDSFLKWSAYILWGAFSGLVLVGVVLLIRSLLVRDYSLNSLFAVAAVALVMGFTVLGAIIPDSLRAEYLVEISSLLESSNVVRDSGISGITLIFKIGHISAFWIGTFVLLSIGRKAGYSITCILFLVVIFAISTEVMQIYRIDRETRVSDFFLDFAGLCLGLLTFTLVFMRRRKAHTV